MMRFKLEIKRTDVFLVCAISQTACHTCTSTLTSQTTNKYSNYRLFVMQLMCDLCGDSPRVVISTDFMAEVLLVWHAWGRFRTPT